MTFRIVRGGALVTIPTPSAMCVFRNLVLVHGRRNDLVAFEESL